MVKRETYLATKDIMDILHISRFTALQIMHEFEAQKQLFKRGRLLRVRKSDFDEWARRHGG